MNLANGGRSAIGLATSTGGCIALMLPDLRLKRITTVVWTFTSSERRHYPEF
ncbi:hypothetical protein MAP00_001513 [Monascus purpureus]|nr:hypothetical protein MAP00_001513 [Monascus purpureus]